MTGSRAFYTKTGTTSGTVAAGDHHHAGADIDSGTVAIGRLPTGTSGTTVAIGNHGHAGADITSGTVAYARLPVGTAAATIAAGDDPRLVALNNDAVTAGEFVPRRMYITNNTVALAAGSGGIHLAYFTADKTETISTVTAYTGATAAAATPTLCRMGIYSAAANGDLTLVAAHANDTTLFAATNTTYAKTLTASFTKTVGQRYATALLVVTGATLPTFHGWTTSGTSIINTIFGVTPAISQFVSGQTDLPASIAAGSIGGGNRSMIAMRLT